MALPSSGPLPANNIANEIHNSIQLDNFSMYEAGVLTYSGLNAAAISSSGKSLKIDPDIPMSMSMWYGYNHQLTFSGSEVVSFGLLAPYPMLNKTLSMQETFLQMDMGTSSITASFTASNLVKSGLASYAHISYSVYYAPYSILLEQYYPEKLIKTGIITTSSLSEKFTYLYNSDSGSIVTFRFQTTNDVAIPTAYINYNQNTSPYSSGVWNNIGTGGSTYNMKSTGSINSGVYGNISYVSISGSVGVNYLSASSFDINQNTFTLSIFGRTNNFSTSHTSDIFSIVKSGSNDGTHLYSSNHLYTPSTPVMTQINHKNNTGYFYYYSTSSVGTPYVFSVGEWYHLVYSANYNTHTASRYTNGYRLDTAALYDSSSNSYYFFDTGSMVNPRAYISNPGYISNNSNFDIHEILIWTGSVLNDEQVNKLYSNYMYMLSSYGG